MNDFYALNFKDTTGAVHSLSDYRDSTLLIVNTATKCGLAGQFKELEALHQKYKDKGLVVIGFPCNQFAKQEAGNDSEIAAFCETSCFTVCFPQ